MLIRHLNTCLEACWRVLTPDSMLVWHLDSAWMLVIHPDIHHISRYLEMHLDAQWVSESPSWYLSGVWTASKCLLDIWTHMQMLGWHLDVEIFDNCLDTLCILAGYLEPIHTLIGCPPSRCFSYAKTTFWNFRYQESCLDSCTHPQTLSDTYWMSN